MTGGHFLLKLCMVLVMLFGLAQGQQYETEAQWITVPTSQCAQEDGQKCGSPEECKTGVDLAFSPLLMKDVFSPPPQQRIFEKEPHAVKRGDPAYFTRCLEYSAKGLQVLLESCSAHNASDAQQLMRNTDDFRLVKRVKGKDGEWWSGGGVTNACSPCRCTHKHECSHCPCLLSIPTYTTT